MFSRKLADREHGFHRFSKIKEEEWFHIRQEPLDRRGCTEARDQEIANRRADFNVDTPPLPKSAPPYVGRIAVAKKWLNKEIGEY